MKRKILFVAQKLDKESLGGTEVYVESITPELRNLGWDIINVWYTTVNSDMIEVDNKQYGNFESVLQDIRPEITHFHNLLPASTPENLLIAKKYSLKTLLSLHTPNVCVHAPIDKYGKPNCGSDFKCTYLRIKLAGFSSLVSLVFSLTDIKLEPFSRFFKFRGITAAHKSAFNKVIKNVDLIHIHCNWLKEVLMERGVSKHKIVYIDTGLPCKESHEKRSIHTPLKVAFVGRMSREKGLDILIDSVRKLSEDTNIKIYLFGKPAKGKHAPKTLEETHKDSRFADAREFHYKQSVAELNKMDVCVVPSTEAWIETGPLTVLESFAAGTPVIGTNLGGIAERVRDGVDGILFPPGDSDKLASILKHLVENPDEIKRLQKNILPQRTMEDVAIEMSSLYEEMLLKADIHRHATDQ